MAINKVFASGEPGGSTLPERPSETELIPAAWASTSPGSTVPVEPGAPREAPDAVAPAGQRIGRYTLLGPLGRGSTGLIWHDDLNDRFVAIKVMPVATSPPDRHRLMSLARRGRKARGENSDHPQIVRMFEYVPPRGTGVEAEGYLVLEYVEGQTLEHLLRQGRVPVCRLIAIMRPSVAETPCTTFTSTQAASSTVTSSRRTFLSTYGGCGRGCATSAWPSTKKSSGSGRSKSREHSPTWRPEQVRGETHRFDGRTDIWAWHRCYPVQRIDGQAAVSRSRPGRDL